MSEEAKVGAFTLAGLALMAFVLFLFGGFSVSSGGYNIYANFTRVVGLAPSAEVLLAGVPIGKVAGVHNEGQTVVVTLNITDGVKIPKDSHVSISSTGIMGEKFVIIIPSGESEYLAKGDYLQGEDELGMDSLFVQLNKMTLQIEDLLTSMNNILGDREFQTSIVKMAENMERVTHNIDSMTSILEAMARDNQGNISGIMANMNTTLASLSRTMQSVENTMANLERVGADPHTADNLKKTLANITESSERIARITAGIEDVTGDERVREDAKALLYNARNLSDKANNMLGALGSVTISPKADVIYSGAKHDWRTNFNVEVGAEDTYLALGVDDIGDGDKVNAQIGKRSKNLGIRAGVVAGEAGLGVDIFAKDSFLLSADVYNPDDATLRLRSTYRLFDKTYLMGEWNDVNDSRKRAFYAGIRQEF